MTSKLYIIELTQYSPGQRHEVLATIIPDFAIAYAHTQGGVWYVRTSLNAEQIKSRLQTYFDQNDEVRINELGDDSASINNSLQWRAGNQQPLNALAHVSRPHRNRLLKYLDDISYDRSVLGEYVTAANLKNWPKT